MNKTIKFFLVGFAILAGIVSCNEDPETVQQGIPSDVILESDSICRRECVVIYGNDLGTFTADNKLYIDDELLPSDSIKVWNNTRIEFMPVQSPGKHTVYALIDTIKTPELSFTLNDIRNIEMVEIAAGMFAMGAEYGLPAEKPVHEVTLTRTILMSKYEISQSVYLDAMGDSVGFAIDETMPAYNISFLDAVKFCNELSQRNKLTSCYTISANGSICFDTLANGFRLPTEAEWEYAARAGSVDMEFSGGEQSLVCWCSLNSGMRLHESGKLAPNPWGLYDMSGNLWEWCFDYFSEDYYKTSPKVNPINLSGSSDSTRMLRGGAFNSGITSCRVTARVQPDEKNTYSGIRLVRNK